MGGRRHALYHAFSGEMLKDGMLFFELIHVLKDRYGHGVHNFIRDPGRPPGRSTMEAIKRGVFHGVRGGVREILAATRLSAARPLPVLLTGGAAGLLLDVLEGDIISIPDLVFEGLYHIACLAFSSE